MKKKYISYGVLVLSVFFLAFSFYFVIDYIKGMVGQSWALKEVVQSTMGVHVADKEVDALIEKWRNTPDIRGMIDKITMSGENVDVVKEALGVKEIYNNGGVISTDLDCSIIQLSKDGALRYKWTNVLKDGTMDWIIKDVNGAIVYENKDTNTSVQGEIKLPAGDYFVYVNWNVVQAMSYNLYINEK